MADGSEIPSSCLFVACIPQSQVGIFERWGRFTHVAEPGMHCFNPLAGTWLAGKLSLRVQQLDVRCETKTKDNVFVTVVCSVQYRVMKDHADDAFYELQNPREQIQSYVFDVVRASVPRIELDQVFEQKNEIAKSVEEELEKVMTAYGYTIQQTLIVDIEPDATVRKAMNEINAAQRMRMAAQEKAEAEKILQVKRAEADAEAKYLSGVGVARQRQAIVDGLRESVLAFSHEVAGTTPKDVLDMVLVTQYFDTMKDIGASAKSNTVFIPHAPSQIADISAQIRNGMLQGNIKQE
ncbi:unnamed protein product [Closterium sp. Naga37s-1]|nr:unnamed protein product [Closterium sp. Naga37s-1]CAI5987298.1 unnamed protein product [Closterium sp. NIES-65]CAI6008149.1 unnamed protein product [Closterium sp. NIES-65]